MPPYQMASFGPSRADDVNDLIDAVKALIIPFIRQADEVAVFKSTIDEGSTQETDATNEPPRTVLVESLKPEVLVDRLQFSLPEKEGKGRQGLLDTIKLVLRYSVNTWDQGFLDKLYSSTNAVGVISELLLSVLNTNVHVYQVSPVLSVIEKITTRTFASYFGFKGPRAGGITCQGGSASNLTSIVIARNTLFPYTKTLGNGTYDFVLFTSEHGHYSVEKAADTCGMGSSNIVSVPVDSEGRMIPSALRDAIVQAKEQGKTPLYVNATAGTTVLGSYDPFLEISMICQEFGLWMHIDASWGGPAIFSSAQKHKLEGTELANSLTVNPHKMMNVPMTCSCLLTNDLSVFHKANTLQAGYLHHSSSDSGEVWDLSDLTLQCGRRGDSLKLALSWIFYGPSGFERQVDHAFSMAGYLALLIRQSPDFELISENPPPCLQVCFYYAPGGQLAESKEGNTKRTSMMVEKLIGRGYMVDYAPGAKGSFFRVVLNWQTMPGTVKGLFKALEEVGKEVVKP